MDLLKKYLQPVFSDHESGSGDVLRKLMDAIYYLTEDDEVTIDAEFPQKIARLSIQKLGYFAVVNHFIDSLLRIDNSEFNKEQLIKFLESYRNQWTGKEAAMATHLRSVQPLQGQQILVHSNSSAVTGMLGEIARADNIENATIFQSISHPKREGLIQGEELMWQGWKVIFIEDAAMGKMLTQNDFVLLGSDVISASTFINKIGSMPLVAAAKLLKVPVYVLGDERKLVDENTLPDWLDARLMNEHPKATDELNLKKGQPGLNYYFEHVPSSWVNGFVLENGIYTPDQLKTLAEKTSYSEEFLTLAQKLK